MFFDEAYIIIFFTLIEISIYAWLAKSETNFSRSKYFKVYFFAIINKAIISLFSFLIFFSKYKHFYTFFTFFKDNFTTKCSYSEFNLEFFYSLFLIN